VVPVGPEPKNEEEQGMNKKDGEFSFVENEGELSPDIGRLVELDGSADNGVQKKEPPEFITDPMQSAKPAGKKEPPGFINDPIQSAETAAKPEIETVEAPVVTERKTEPAEQELVVPVVISRSQVRKTVPIKLRLEIRVIDD
jgi:hypothetical protein